MTKTNHVVVAAVLLMSVGCSPKYYVPNTVNVPMIQAKGQTNLTVAGNGNQVEFQGAYGLGGSVAFQVNGGAVIPRDEDNGNGGSGRLLEAGVGVFRNVSPNVLFDVYALAGVGTVDNDFPTTVAANNGHYGENFSRYDALQFATKPQCSWKTLFHLRLSADLQPEVSERPGQFSF
ncbi:MAG: hypothetical protein KA371_00140 [Acidobacteria bacterium]|nr:hypothetical protein [Acidobacteriota bacterium]